MSFGIKNNPLTMFCIVKYSNASYNDELLDFEEFDCDDNHIEYVYLQSAPTIGADFFCTLFS